MKRILLMKDCDEKDLEIKSRKASRAIMFKDGLIVMIKSKRFGDYKFPGGGQKPNEFLKQTLIREVLEETGFDVDPCSIKEFGKVEEIHLDAYERNKLFNNISYFYLCDFVDNGKGKNMDNYEKEYGYEVVYTTIDNAIDENTKLLKGGPDWVRREIEVLKYIKSVL